MNKEIYDDEEGEELSAEAVVLWIIDMFEESGPYPDTINCRILDKEALLLKTKYGEEFVISVEKKKLEVS
jgi:hypothetical protein